MGEVSYMEFIAAAHAVRRMLTDEGDDAPSLQLAFHILDRDSDGWITEEDIRAVLAPGEMSDSVISAMFDHADSNGRISVAMLREMVVRRLTEMSQRTSDSSARRTTQMSRNTSSHTTSFLEGSCSINLEASSSIKGSFNILESDPLSSLLMKLGSPSLKHSTSLNFSSTAENQLPSSNSRDSNRVTLAKTSQAMVHFRVVEETDDNSEGGVGDAEGEAGV